MLNFFLVKILYLFKDAKVKAASAFHARLIGSFRTVKLQIELLRHDRSAAATTSIMRTTAAFANTITFESLYYLSLDYAEDGMDSMSTHMSTT